MWGSGCDVGVRLWCGSQVVLWGSGCDVFRYVSPLAEELSQELETVSLEPEWTIADNCLVTVST